MRRTKKRTTRAYVWLTPQEKDAWKTLAAPSGMCLNDYIRCCVERRKIPQPLPEVNRLTAVELGKIGVNLNQQIRAMNTAVASGQDIPNMEESLAVVEKVYEAVRALQKELLLRGSLSRTASAEFDSESIDYGVSVSKPLARYQSVNKKRQMADGRRHPV